MAPVPTLAHAHDLVGRNSSTSPAQLLAHLYTGVSTEGISTGVRVVDRTHLQWPDGVVIASDNLVAVYDQAFLTDLQAGTALTYPLCTRELTVSWLVSVRQGTQWLHHVGPLAASRAITDGPLTSTARPTLANALHIGFAPETLTCGGRTFTHVARYPTNPDTWWYRTLSQEHVDAELKTA